MTASKNISRLFRTAGLVLVISALTLLPPTASQRALAKGDDFGMAVKLIERFFNVKHESLPFLARAGMKAAKTAMRISGGQRKRIAELGSVKVAFFEDQDFSSGGNTAVFKSSINAALTGTWSPLVQTTAGKEHQQTYIYLREADQKFQVLVITIEPREAVVVQATVNPNTLAMLMQTPDEMGRVITNDATTNDNDQE
ncbi:MAG: hypothetical protein QOD75_2351 [Blastocatellia bacterium]|jgi:hypothetical protein|nr:hypothetical protein [Blastocatellia bacterium]